MTLLFMEGFDHVNDRATLLRKWTGYFLVGDDDLGTSFGRRGTRGVRFDGTYSGLWVDLPTEPTEIYVGLACYPTATQNLPVLFQLMASGSSLAHISVEYNGGAGLKVYRDQTTTLLGTGSINVTTGQWYYLELYAKISDTVGAIKLRVNGTLDLDLSNIDTKTGSYTTIPRFYLGGYSGSQSRSAYYDDIYICDASGSTNNNFLGDCIVDTIFPDGTGDSSQWSPSSGVNYAAVDEALTTTGNTDYVSSSTNGHRDLYTFSDIAQRASSTVYGIQTNVFARLATAGETDTVAASAKLSGTTVDATAQSLTDTLTYKRFIRETDPTGTAWTQTSINDTQFGIKEVV